MLCSGPSVKNFVPENRICIVPNRSIYLPQLQDQQYQYDYIIWVIGTGWKKKLILEWLIEICKALKVLPDAILLRTTKQNKGPVFDHAKTALERTFRDKPVMIDILYQHIKPYGLISTGMSCVKLGVDCECQEIVVSGMEMGINTKYCTSLTDKGIISKYGYSSGCSHLLNDISCFKGMIGAHIISPDKNSGLFQFLKITNNSIF